MEEEFSEFMKKDEKISVLKKKLQNYVSKQSDMRKKFEKSSNQSAKKILQTLENAIKITSGLIEERTKELQKQFEESLKDRVYYVGETVYAKKNGVWYTGSVDKVIPRLSKRDYEYLVKLYGLDQDKTNLVFCTPSKDTIKPYNHPYNLLKKGMKVFAVYDNGDENKFYEAIIDSLDDMGWCWVKYLGYTGVFKIKMEHIRLMGEEGKKLYGIEEKEEDIIEKKVMEKKNEESSEKTSEKKMKRFREMDKFEKKRLRKKRKKEKMEEGEKMLEEKKNNWSKFLNKNKNKLNGLKQIENRKERSKKRKKDLGGVRSREEKIKNVHKKDSANASAFLQEMEVLKEMEKSKRKKGRRYFEEDFYDSHRRRRDDGYSRRYDRDRRYNDSRRY